jgi:uncharacterized protein
MTATDTPTWVDHTPAPTPPRRIRRRWLAAAAVIAVLVAVAVTLRPVPDAVTHVLVPLDDAVQGTYRLADGEHLTLWGSAEAPSYELAGRATGLMADDADRYVSMSGDEILSVVRDESGAVAGVRLDRPDQPEAFAVADHLHDDQDVRIASDGAVLAGTLLLPPGPGPHPAVVFAPGAGPQDRHGTFRLLGSHLARRGVAAIIYDKRGVGDSTGSYTAATFDDLTADVLAGVDLLTDHPRIDPARIGVAGFSQGAWQVAEAARRTDDVAFVVALSASGFTPGDQQAWLHGSMLAARGFDRSAMVVADRVSRMLYSSLDLVEAGVMPPIPHVPGFWFHALDLHKDTAALWEGVRQPALLAWGAEDCQVPAHDSMETLGRALERGGNTNVTLTVLPGADHSLVLHEPCEMETGGHHGTYTYAEGVLALAADWINALPDTRTAMPVAARPDPSILDWHLEPPLPAPWYGTIPVQLAALMLLLTAFGIATGRWAVAGVRAALTRGQRVSLPAHLGGAAGLVGLAATLTGFAAFAEIAILGGVHAAPLVGGPTVEGTSLLMTAARVLVTLAAGLGPASAGVLVRGGRQPNPRAAAVTIAATALLVVWGAYWRLLPLL